MTQQILFGCAIVITLIAAVWDYRWGIIPNWLTLPTIVIGPIVAWVTWGMMVGIRHVAGVFICGFVPFLLYRRNAMGGGDTKLFAAIGGLLGMKIGVEIELIAVFVGLLISLGRMAWGGSLLQSLGNIGYLMANPLLPKHKRREPSTELMQTVRMGIPVAVATLAILFIRSPHLWS